MTGGALSSRAGGTVGPSSVSRCRDRHRLSRSAPVRAAPNGTCGPRRVAR